MEFSGATKQDEDEWVEAAETCLCCLSVDALNALTRDESGEYKLQKIFALTDSQIGIHPGVPSYLCAMCESRLKMMDRFRSLCNTKNAMVDAFIKKQKTAMTESVIAEDHVDHSAEQTVGTETKTEATPPDGAKDLHLNRRCLTVHESGRTYECCGHIPDDLFEAGEYQILLTFCPEEVDE